MMGTQELQQEQVHRILWHWMIKAKEGTELRPKQAQTNHMQRQGKKKYHC